MQRRKRHEIELQRQLAADLLALLRAAMPSHLLTAIRMHAAALERLAEHARVLLADVVVRIEHHDHHVRLGDRLQGARDAGTLDRILDPRAAAHAGGVDEQEFAPVALERHQDAVARGAGLLAGDHALLADQAIDQRRLADVRPADDRDADRRGVVRLARIAARRPASTASISSRQP